MNGSESASRQAAPSPSSSSLRQSAWIWGALAAVFILGAALRFADLGGESIWRDEGTSIYLAHQPVGEILRNRAGFNHCPLHFVLLRGWVSVFGDSEASVRAPSAIFGSLSILLMFIVTLQLFRKRGTALAAALLMAVSLFQVEYSQEARMYSMLAFLGLAATCCFIKLLRGGGALWWGLYMSASLLLVYTHLSGWALIAVHNLAWIVRRIASPRPAESSAVAWAASQLALLLLFTPWLWAMSSFDAGLPLKGDFGLGKLRSTLKGQAGSYPLMAAYLLAIAGALVAALRGKKSAPQSGNSGEKTTPNWVARNAAALFAAAWWLTPLAILTALCAITGTRIMDRYTIIGSLAAFPLAALGVSRLPRRALRLAALGLFLALSVQPFVEYYAVQGKDGWREAVAYVEEHAQSDEPVLFLMYRDEWYIKTCFDYYGNKRSLDRQAFKYSTRKIPSRKRLKKFIPDRLLKHRRLWLIRLTTTGSRSHYERLLTESGYRKNVSQDFSGLLVMRWDRAAKH
jgi:mannosyltransferase